MVHLDFETKSTVDLLKCGTYVYAQDPTTDVNCMAWALNDEAEIELWCPGDPLPARLLQAIEQGLLIAAWNAQFERLIWNNVLVRYGFPPLPIERFYCVAALSRARGYPGKLEKAALFSGLRALKDMEGHYLMLKLCKPRHYEADGTPVWWDYQPDYERLGEYCKQDVNVERALFNQFIPFTDEELSEYHLSEHINDTGVHVDLELAQAAVDGFEREKFTSDHIVMALTGGAVTACTQVQKMKAWIEEEWREIPSMNKTDLIDALGEEDIPPHVAEVIDLRLNNAKAAVSKFAAIVRHSINGVVYGGYLYRGAGQTGRFSSLGVQRHNLQRECRTDTIPLLKKRGIKALAMVGDPVVLLGQMVRPAFVAAPGNKLVIGDFSQIEARITAWLAEEEALLELFRTGGDPYCDFGTDAFGRVITKADDLERFMSKGCVLGLGFGGSEGALARTFKSQGNLTVPLAERTHLVQVYRTKYANIKRFWYALNGTVLKAMFAPGTICPISRVHYMFDGQHLWCRLPSGRLMCYPFAEVVQDDYGGCVQYRRANRSPKKGETEWPVVRLWHGIETENLAQAIAADILIAAMKRLATWNLRMHTHDEIITEAPEATAVTKLELMLQLMCVAPEWADGLPIAAEGLVSDRYVKDVKEKEYKRSYP